LHDELPGPRRQGPARRFGIVKGRHHHGARLHERPALGRRPAQGPPPLEGRQRERDPHDDRRRKSRRRGPPGPEGEARRHRDARAGARTARPSISSRS
jgi:hypothetical protein